MKHKFILMLFILMTIATGALYAQAYALEYDGNDNTNMGDLGFTGTTYTVEAWIYPTTLGTPTYARTILATSNGFNTYTMWFGTYNNEIRVWSYATSNTNYQTTTGANLAINNWYHIAVTATKGGLTRVYVNGVQKLSYTNLGLGVNWSAITTIGDLRPERALGFMGKIADVRVWNVIRTPAEIQYGMNNDLVGNETGLIGYWPCHEGSGTLVEDHAGIPHDGTLDGAPYDPSWTTGKPYVEISSSNPAVPAGTVTQGTLKHPIYSFTVKPYINPSTVNQVVFSSTGSYVATDVDNFKLWYSTTNDIATASQIGSTITTSLGTGDHTFAGLTQAIATGVTGYFWVTTDIAVAATAGNTITVPVLSPDKVTLSAGFKVGSASAAGTQTIDVPLPLELSSFTAVLTVENYVRLTWVTQSETSLGGYYIYRSDSNDWANATKISELIYAGNTPLQQEYQFTDNQLTNEGMYYYWLQVQELDGSSYSHGPTIVNYVNTESGNEVPVIVPAFGINNIYPNPITPYSMINYHLTKSANVEFKVYNSRGQLVRNFTDGYRVDGDHSISWNGKDDKGNNCPTGVYFIKMQAGNAVSTRKAMIIK